MEVLKLDANDINKTVVERILRNSDEFPNKTALICDDEEVSFKTLGEMIVSLYRYLIEKGLSKKDGVAIQSLHNKYCIATYYAIHLLGAVLIPLEKNIPEERVKEICNEADAKLIISKKQINDSRFCSYDEIIANARNTYSINFKEFVYPDLDDICEMVFTTGTTGKSKGVLISHRSMSYYCYTVAKAIEMKEDNRFFITTPLNHAGGLRRTHLSLANGCCVIYLDGLMNLNKYFYYICKYHATSLYLPPVAIRVLLNSAKEELVKIADQIDFIYSSSSPLAEIDSITLANIFPNTRLYNAYEASETPGVSVYDYNNMAPLKGCLGKANEGVKIGLLVNGEIINDSDVQGQICVSSSMNMSGYYQAPDLTSSVFKNEWYISSDLGHLDKDGNLYYDGRIGDVINIGGYKISPNDVEEIALLNENIAECICIESINMLNMPILKLLVVPKNDGFDSKELISMLSSRLELYKVPKIVEEVDQIQKTFNGKLNRKYYRQ